MGMTLRQYMRELGIDGFGASSDTPHSLRVIGRFEFGELFSISLVSGSHIDMNSVDAMLDVLTSELALAPEYDAYATLVPATISSETWRGMRVHTTGNILAINISKVLPIRPDRAANLDALCENVRLWVAEYYLSGEWSAEIPRVDQGFLRNGARQWMS